MFVALGDPTRLALLARLGTDGACTATRLASDAPITRQALIGHLRVLEGGGWVTRKKRGREVLYAVRVEQADEARAVLDGLSAGWDRAIDRLRTVVEDPETSGGRP
jgi:DNA-binding transcriptional ArsR family regulator